MRTHPLPVLTAALLLAAAAAQAQDKPKSKDTDKSKSNPDVYVDAGPGRILRAFSYDQSANRAMIGISTSSSGRRDTLGLLVTSVTPNGPAEKAGIVEGNRIAAINGVNLRLAAADAGEDDMDGIAARRLTRELSKLEPGADVELRVYADGQWKTVRLKTVARDSLSPARYFRSSDSDDRAVLGFQLNASGSKRDTLGVFVGSVKEDGPAEKAGLVEGDRVVSVNGTDLRVSRDDVGDGWVSSTMVNRFQRVMRAVKPGDKVQLRVYSGGQVKNVTVTAAKSSDIYKEERGRFRAFAPDVFGFEGGPVIVGTPAVPPVPPMPAIAPRVRINSMDMDDDLDDEDDDVASRVDVERALEAAREAARATTRSNSDAMRAIERSKASSRALLSSAANVAADAPVMAAIWSTAAATNFDGIEIPGLSLAPVTPELAEYLGKGSEEGLLVLEASGPWGNLHAGDVILSVDGTALCDGGFNALEGHDVVVLRKGRNVDVRM
jgi:C-terminal processing protease CtpA/Prc